MAGGDFRGAVGFIAVLVLAAACSRPTTTDTPEVVSVSIAGGNRTIQLGESAIMTAHVTAKGGAGTTVTWASSAPAVAIVDSTGTVYAVAQGEAAITATSTFDGSKSATVGIKVVAKDDGPEDAPEVVSVFITGGERSISVGGSTILTALVAAKGGASTEVTWASNAPTVANVSSSGSVHGVTPGIVEITATSVFDSSKSATVTISVSETDVPPDNAAPIARIVASNPATGFAPLVIQFDGSESSDPDDDALVYFWEFGDGLTAHGVRVEHTYVNPGSFLARLTVTDGAGASSSATTAVVAGQFTFRQRLAATQTPADYYSRQWIAVDTDMALVPVVTDAGSAFTQVDVYHADPASSTWNLEASLIPSLTHSQMIDIGRAVALSDGTAALMSLRRVSGITDEYESVINVFERSSSGDWIETAALLGGLGIGKELTYRADISMALANGVLVVGITSVDDDFGARVRIYSRDSGGAGVWGLEQTLAMPPFAPTDFSGYFGTDVAISNDGKRIAVAKSVQNNDGGLGPLLESVYLYERSGEGTWYLLKALDGYHLLSGYSTYVEIDGDTMAVTHMPAHTSTTIEVEVYEKDAGGPNAWGRVAKHTADIPEMELNGGTRMARSSIRLMGNSLAVGIASIGCTPADGYSCGPGRVYLYGRDVGGHNAWGQAQVLIGQGPATDYTFGTAVDISSDGRSLLVATGPRDSTGIPAEIYRYSR